MRTTRYREARTYKGTGDWQATATNTAQMGVGFSADDGWGMPMGIRARMALGCPRRVDCLSRADYQLARGTECGAWRGVDDPYGIW